MAEGRERFQAWRLDDSREVLESGEERPTFRGERPLDIGLEEVTVILDLCWQSPLLRQPVLFSQRQQLFSG